MEINKQRIAELVREIQNGNNSAFDELYKLTSQRAYFVALEFTKNNQDAEDILQESYIKALSKINEIDNPESFSSWLNQIVANKSKDFLKKKKPMLFEEEEKEVFEFIPDEDTEFSPEENLDQTELQKTVMEVLDELSEEKRACVLMMYFEELSVGEIAESLEIPEGTVKTRLFSARKDLKEKFAKRGITSTFSFAPMGVVAWALRRMSDSTSKIFVASGASSKVLAGITVAGTGVAASVAAGTTAATTAATAAAVGTGTATATATGTGIAAKIAALTVAQKVIAGVSVAAVVAGGTAGVVTVVNNDDKKDDISTTAYTEEYTTAPSYETDVTVEAMGTVEFSENTDLSVALSTNYDGSTVTNSTTAPQSGSDNKTTTVSGKTENVSKSEKQTTTKAATTNKATTVQTSTTKATTTKKQTETKTEAAEKATTQKVTTTKAVTTAKATTTKATTTTTNPTTTTTKPTTTTTNPTTTTTKPTTTEATTKGSATVIVKFVDQSGNTLSDQVSGTITAGETISEDFIFGLAESKYEIDYSTPSGNVGAKAEAGKTYTYTVKIFDA